MAKRIGILLGLVWSVACLAQAPPPEVDKALRERIAKFYQAHVEAKYRQAEQLIAEENRDDFYNNAKTKYVSFGESKIDYSDNFTKAVVHTPTEMIWRVAQLGEMKLNKLAESNWKLVDGQWYWYQPPGYGLMTPFSPDGKTARMQPGPGGVAAGESVSDRVKKFDMRSLSNVELSKKVVRLSKKGGASDSVEVKNGLAGAIVVQVDHSELPGLEVTVTPSQLKSGETAKVQFKYNPPKAVADPKLQAKVVIQPTQQSFPLAITFEDESAEGPKHAK